MKPSSLIERVDWAINDGLKYPFSLSEPHNHLDEPRQNAAVKSEMSLEKHPLHSEHIIYRNCSNKLV